MVGVQRSKPGFMLSLLIMAPICDEFSFGFKRLWTLKLGLTTSFCFNELINFQFKLEKCLSYLECK